MTGRYKVHILPNGIVSPFVFFEYKTIILFERMEFWEFKNITLDVSNYTWQPRLFNTRYLIALHGNIHLRNDTRQGRSPVCKKIKYDGLMGQLNFDWLNNAFDITEQRRVGIVP